MNFLKSAFRKPLAWAHRKLNAAAEAECQKLRDANKRLRSDIRQHVLREKSDAGHILQLTTDKRLSEDTVENLHKQILEMESEKADLEVEVEKLENVRILNELDIEGLTEKLQKHIEINRLERISAQLESNYLAQQGRHNGIDQPEQHRRERPSSATMEGR